MGKRQWLTVRIGSENVYGGGEGGGCCTAKRSVRVAGFGDRQGGEGRDIVGAKLCCVGGNHGICQRSGLALIRKIYQGVVQVVHFAIIIEITIHPRWHLRLTERKDARGIRIIQEVDNPAA